MAVIGLRTAGRLASEIGRGDRGYSSGPGVLTAEGTFRRSLKENDLGLAVVLAASRAFDVTEEPSAVRRDGVLEISGALCRHHGS